MIRILCQTNKKQCFQYRKCGFNEKYVLICLKAVVFKSENCQNTYTNVLKMTTLFSAKYVFSMIHTFRQ